MNELNELQENENPFDGIGFLTDDNGRPSAVRLYGLIIVVGGVLLAFLSTYWNSWTGATLSIALVGTAYTGKVLQKSVDLNNLNNTSNI